MNRQHLEYGTVDVSKETYIRMKRELSKDAFKETYMNMKRDLWKETHMDEKRPIHLPGKRVIIMNEKRPLITSIRSLRMWHDYRVKRDLYDWKEAYIFIWKKSHNMNTKRPLSTSIRSLRMWHDYRVKRDLYTYETRPMKRDLWIWKETNKHEKGPLSTLSVDCECGTTIVSKETYIHMKRDLWKETYEYEKRPINMKRDL